MDEFRILDIPKPYTCDWKWWRGSCIYYEGDRITGPLNKDIAESSVKMLNGAYLNGVLAERLAEQMKNKRLEKNDDKYQWVTIEEE